MSKTREPKILYLDIENSQMIVEFPTYTLYNIDRIHPKHIKHDWYITCAAWAWLDNTKQKVGKVMGSKVSDFKTAYKKDFRDDLGVVKELHKVMQEADLIVGHNSDSFDIKKINYRFIKHGLQPIDLPPTVDTLKAAKKYARSSSNSLYFLAKEFNVPMKIDLGAGIMHKADRGCKKALEKLFVYCKGDIKAGASLYFKLLPYIKNHPNLNRIIGRQLKATPEEVCNCSSCGSTNIKKWGSYPTKTGPVQRLICNDCGSSVKAGKGDK